MKFPKFYISKTENGYTIYKSGSNFKRYSNSIICSDIKSYDKAKIILEQLLNLEPYAEEIYSLTDWIKVNTNKVGLSTRPNESQTKLFHSLKDSASDGKLKEYIALIEIGLKIDKVSINQLSKVINILKQEGFI